MDFSKIPTEDLQAIQAGQWDKVSTPGLQEYQNQRSHQAQAQQQAQAPQTTPDAADKASYSSDAQKVLASTNLSPKTRQQMQMAHDQASTPQGTQQLATTLLPGAASALSQGAGAMSRIGVAGAMGGATAVGVQDPNLSASDKLSSFLKGGAIGAGLQGVGEAAGKIGDYLMQRSVGLRRYTPGIGTSLADQGVIGTKGMMANQVDNKLAAEEDSLQGLVKDLSGTVNSKEIADAVSQKAQRFTLPSTGEASPFSQQELQKVRDMSGKLSQMGDLSASDLLALKRQGDYQGFTAGGNPATSTEAELGRTGANAARTALKNMSPDVADSLFKEQALVKANSALSRPDTIHQGNVSSMIFGKLPGQSIAESVGGQAAVKGGQVISDPRTQRALEQGLFGQ